MAARNSSSDIDVSTAEAARIPMLLASAILILFKGQTTNTVIGDWGECVQAPIARVFAPNVCSALAPP